MRLIAQAAGALSLLPPQAVRDTIASVFSHPGYDQSFRQSLGERFLGWIARTLAAWYEALRGSVDIRWVVIAGVAVLVSAIVVRALFLAGVSAERRRRAWAQRPGHLQDPWDEASRAAAAGRHMDAAHLLYAAVLETISIRHRVPLHPSRTAGEYERDLRLRNPAAVHVFAAFAREYERVVWRVSSCDRACYERLVSLARAVAASEPARAAA